MRKANTPGLTCQSPSSSSVMPPPASPSSFHRMKLEVPRFDGADPVGWIFKINQFFEYHSTPEHECLTIASFYMEGRALTWFHFAPSQYKDPTRALFKLTQRNKVNAYLSEFEDLANRIIGLPLPFLLSCFISGLTPEICREVQALQPLTLVQAAGLARLQEETFLDSRCLWCGRTTSISSSFTILSSTTFVVSSSSPLLLAPQKATLSLPIKRLPLEELALWWEHGLCFNCDRKFHRDHKCTSKVFLLIADEDEGLQEDNLELGLLPDLPNTQISHLAQIILHTLSGHLAPETLRLLGHIADQQVVILVDEGSTHNFVQEHLVHSLGLPTRATPPVRVMVVNGHQLHCHLLCEAFLICVQGVTFFVDLHVLSLCSANLVLGIQWLKSLSPILTNG
ncbi:hypothetical protein HKD37_18G050308 [Glycine soja]